MRHHCGNLHCWRLGAKLGKSSPNCGTGGRLRLPRRRAEWLSLAIRHPELFAHIDCAVRCWPPEQDYAFSAESSSVGRILTQIWALQLVDRGSVATHALGLDSG